MSVLRRIREPRRNTTDVPPCVPQVAFPQLLAMCLTPLLGCVERDAVGTTFNVTRMHRCLYDTPDSDKIILNRPSHGPKHGSDYEQRCHDAGRVNSSDCG